MGLMFLIRKAILICYADLLWAVTAYVLGLLPRAKILFGVLICDIA